MKKKFIRNKSRYLAMALSASMVVGNMTVPMNAIADDFTFSDDDGYYNDTFEMPDDTEADENEIALGGLKISDEMLEGSNSVIGSSSAKIGSAEFWAWYTDASEDDLREWHDGIRKEDVATEANADRDYPAFSEDDDFMEWLYSECTKETDEGQDFDYDKIADYLASVDFESAKGLLDYLFAMTPSLITNPIGGIFPDDYGKQADFMTDNQGSGTIDSPYVIDSVEDLRGLAVYTMENDTTGKYFKLTARTYDLQGVWIPIGFTGNPSTGVQDQSYHPFKGHIGADNGAVIKNLGFGYGNGTGVTSEQAEKIRNEAAIGFFGALSGASVEGLEIQTNGNTIEGSENTGILAGYAVDSVIKNCTVNGKVKGKYNVGGIVGLIESTDTATDHRTSVIEDCKASDVSVYVSDRSDARHPNVGGIAGKAEAVVIADTYVSTNTGSGNHIYGSNAYTGGVVGLSINSDIYNTQVEKGEIGSQDDYAVGGIVGGYGGGQIKVARFSGTTIPPTSTNNYNAAFVGTRYNNAGFTYGESGNLAYLFTDSKEKADSGICGSKISGDSDYGYDAHIGYWHQDNTYYTLVSGMNTDNKSEAFYKELERGIINIKKTGHYTQEGSNKKVIINHYTADANGYPTRGYVLTVVNPKVEGDTAAEITATIKESYKPTVTEEIIGAYAEGDLIYISFKNKSKGDVQFRLDDTKTPNPYYAYHEYKLFDEYTDDGINGEVTRYQLDEDGGYWLEMPAADTIVSAEYKSVATALDLTPDKMIINVTQTRSGNRDNPTIIWTATVTDENGSIITDTHSNRLENITLFEGDNNPEIYIGSLINNATNDSFNLNWAVDNTTKGEIQNHKIIESMKMPSGLDCDKEAKFSINIKDSAMADFVTAERAKQISNENRTSMTTVRPEYYHTLITATVQSPDAQLQKDPPKGFTDIDIYFNIVDNTQTSVLGTTLNKKEITYNVVRTITGDRTAGNFTEEYTIDGKTPNSSTLTSDIIATFKPDYFSMDKVKWYITAQNPGDDVEVDADKEKQGNEVISVASDPSHLNDYHYGMVSITGLERYSAELNPWIKSIKDSQNTEYTYQSKIVPDDTKTSVAYVKVSAYDDNGNVKTDTCKVTVNFKTVDKTVIHPTEVKIDDTFRNLSYDLSYTMENDIHSAIVERNGFGTKQLSAAITPDYEDEDPEYTPYNNDIVWSSSNPQLISVNPETGLITVLGYDADHPSEWINAIVSGSAPYNGETTVTITARAADNFNTCIDTIEIPVKFHVNSVDVSEDDLVFDTVLTQNMMTTVDDYSVEQLTWSGDADKYFTASATGTVQNPEYTILTGSEYIDLKDAGDGTATVSIKKEAQWIKDIIEGKADSNSATKTATVQIKTRDGRPVETRTVTINFRYDATKLDIHETSLDVVATQGDNTMDVTGTRTWSIPSGKLAPTVYDRNGIGTGTRYDVSDSDLLSVSSDGTITPKQADWMLDIINQGTTGENHKGSKVVYVTALSDDGVTKDVCKVTINFRYDNTVLLTPHEQVFNVVYTVDSRTNSPKSHWTGLDPITLRARTYGANGTDETPSWSTADETALTVDTDGRIAPVENAQWMQDIMNAGGHSGSKTVIVKAISDDATTADSCTVTINFRYDVVELSKNEETFNVVMTQTRRTNNPAVVWSGNVAKKLTASVWTEAGKSNNAIWQVEDDTILVTDQSGNILPVINARWMLDIVADGKFSGTRITAVDASSLDKTIKDSANVTVNFNYEDVVLSKNALTMDVVLTASGYRTSPTYAITGDTAKLLATVNSVDPDEKAVKWTSSNNGILTVDANGNLTFVLPKDEKGNITPATSEFIKAAMNNSAKAYTNAAVVVIDAATVDGRMSDQCNVTVNFKYVDNTRSYSSGGSSGGGGGGGGGGSSSSGITPSGTTSSRTSLPSYVVSGTWVQDATGRWLFTSGRTYKNEWAAVHNPYANTAAGQSAFDWFRFGEDGFMLTGWYTDVDGNVYYLNPSPDGTQGRMFTGWNWITGADGLQRCYFFETQSNGVRGSLYRNRITPDGYTVDETGAWTQNGIQITRVPQ